MSKNRRNKRKKSVGCHRIRWTTRCVYIYICVCVCVCVCARACATHTKYIFTHTHTHTHKQTNKQTNKQNKTKQNKTKQKNNTFTKARSLHGKLIRTRQSPTQNLGLYKIERTFTINENSRNLAGTQQPEEDVKIPPKYSAYEYEKKERKKKERKKEK